MWILYCLCLVASAAGQDDVRLPPSITKNPDSTVIFKEFDQVILECRAEGTPPITFEWKQNSQRLCITSNSTLTILGVFVGDLTIFNATRCDDGFYQCFATNQYGTAVSTVAFLHDASPSYTNITVQEGHPFVIPAARGNSFPTSKCNWTTTVTNSTYGLSPRVRDTWNGDLHFAYAVKEDELNGSIYKSTVFNAANNAILGERYTRVTVTQNSGSPPGFPPNITYFAKLQKVAPIGRDIELKCFFSGKPLPNITWTRPGLPFGRHEIPGSHHRTLLKIYNSTKSDEGEYVCTANNTMGTANHTFNISDEADGPRDVNVTEGDSITFNCSAFAKPNGKPIDGLCSRMCLPNATCSQTNNNGCFDKGLFSDLLEMAKEEALNQTTVVEIAKQLQALTSKSEVLSPGNLNASVMIIKQLAGLLRDRTNGISLNEKQIESFVHVISNVLQTKNAASWKELEKVNSTIATAIWTIGDDFGQILATLDMPGHVNVSTDNLFLEAWSIEKSNLSLQVEFPKGSEWGENRGDGISISMETLNASISSESQRTLNMWGVYYRTMDKILPGKKDGDDVLNSRILSFSIEGLKTNQTLKPPVTITLRHNQEKRRSYQRTCAFWNFNRNDWDSYGCTVTSTNATHTICSCDHLTNFAILMSRNPVKDELLSLFSIIGCSISVASLVLTVIVYAVTWKHAKSSQAALLLNLCVALIIAYIIFMAGADKIESSGFTMVGCKVVAVMLHYFFLVAFFIMLAEGIDMVLYIFFVFHVRRTRETVMLIASAWVLPLIIVGVSLGVTKFEGYGHEEACWLSIDSGLIWAFIGPVMCIIAINLVILIIILRLISQKKALLAGNGKKRDEIKATIWNLSVMCPVLGLGWLFGVFSVSFDHVAFQYVFVVANSLHGLLIFIIYALFHNKKMNEKISAVYSNCIDRCGKTGPSVFIKLSSSQDHSTSSASNTQLTSDRKKSTSEAAPAYGVIAATHLTSAQKPGI